MAGTLNYYRGTAPRLAPAKEMPGPKEYSSYPAEKLLTILPGITKRRLQSLQSRTTRLRSLFAQRAPLGESMDPESTASTPALSELVCVASAFSLPCPHSESREMLLALREQATNMGVEWSIDDTASDIRFSMGYAADQKNGTYAALPKHYEPLLSELPAKKADPPKGTSRFYLGHLVFGRGPLLSGLQAQTGLVYSRI